EAAAPKNVFVYITHNVEFAASRIGAKKIMLTQFDGQRWDWYEIADNESIPEASLLEILGSRKPILFVEGHEGRKGSFEKLLFESLYPELTVIQAETASNVINATASFSAQGSLHRLSCQGMVDGDRRTQAQIDYLRERGVSVLPAFEIENMLLYEDV